MSKKFKSIDGLRAFLAIGIVLMHIQANTSYEINGYVWNSIIPALTHFVYLFMMISGFAMCCGYYDKIKNGTIKPNEFYKKRFSKILPFFAIVVLIEVLYTRTLTSVTEGITELTLSFSLLPNVELSVIGVGWFLGIVFLFYMIFPYFVFLLDNKKRAWGVLAVALLLNFACIGHFFTSEFVLGTFTPRHNFLYDFIYFVIGGIIYLYKEELIKIVSNKKWLFLILSIICAILYMLIPNNPYIFTIKTTILFAVWLIYAIGTEGKILNNRFTTFMSSISMEIYLSHMIIFRLLEKVNLLNLTPNSACNYIIVVVITLAGTVGFVFVIKKVFEYAKEIYNKKRVSNTN